MRYLIFFSYDGSEYDGLVEQPERVTVMGRVREAFLKNSITVQNLIPSSRTDKGVHAINQTAHFDIPFYIEGDKLMQILNNALPKSIKINKIFQVDDGFHARFHAKKRFYRYVFKESPTPFEARFVAHIEAFDNSFFQELLSCFVGRYDFGYFKKEGTKSSSDIREIYKIALYEHNAYKVVQIVGNAFLRAQIRIMIGFVLEAQKKGFGAKELKLQLAKKERFSSRLADPNGLHLVRVFY